MRFFALSAAALAATLSPVQGGAATAAEMIGSAIALTPAASGTESGRLALGDGVVRKESVSTGPSGVLELEFLDKTHLALGPASAVTLNQFVFDGGRRDAIVLGLARGAFRFATGVAAKKAYRIETPMASIGVRGTAFNVRLGPGVMRITLEHGQVEVCPHGGGACTTLKRPRQTIDFFSNGRSKAAAEPFLPTMACSQGGGGLCRPYGSSKSGFAVDPSEGGNGGRQDAEDRSRPGASRPSAPPPSPPPTNPTPGTGGNRGPC
jgi:ferric-dicitrate binding protein FerR (iron transport regulator)